MVITGSLLFYAIPVRTYQSVWFRAKVIFLILAGINVLFFHTRVETSIAQWDTWHHHAAGGAAGRRSSR